MIWWPWIATAFALGFISAVALARQVLKRQAVEIARLRQKLRAVTTALQQSNRLLHGVCDRRM